MYTKNCCIEELKNKANEIRKSVVNVALANGAGHIAPSLSCIDILTALYYEIMNISKDNNRDRLVFSKAHGCYGIYAILADLGILGRELWLNFYKDSPLSGCIERDEKHLIEASCGSLGHGLSMATGIAFGYKIQNISNKVFCIVGDGEMQEGTMWEALQFASKHNLDNLAIIVDNNGLQAMDFTDNVLTPNLEKKLEAFGCIVQTCDGHNIESIISAINTWKNNNALKKPLALVANTVKGYGLKCMENIPKFHFRLPSEEELLMGNRYE